MARQATLLYHFADAWMISRMGIERVGYTEQIDLAIEMGIVGDLL